MDRSIEPKPLGMATPHLETLTEILAECESSATTRPQGSGPDPTPMIGPLLDAIDTVVFFASSNGGLRYVNAAWSRLTGYTLRETRELERPVYLHPQDQEVWMRFLDARKRGGRGVGAIVLRFLTKAGESLYLEARAQAVTGVSRRCMGFVGTLSDVGSRVQAEELKEASHRTIETLINNLPGLVYRGRNNRRWTMEFISEGCLALTGYPPAALINNDRLTFGDLIVPEDREQVWDNVQTALRENRPFELMYRIKTAQGQEKWVLERGRGNLSTSGELLGLEGFITDITREKQEQLRLRSDSLRDVTTGLPTPSLFLDRLEMALRRSKLHSHPTVAVLIVHLDRFDKWREKFGADFGNRALFDVGKRIGAVLGPTDSLCHWQDQEFAILHECPDFDIDAAAIGSKIQQELRAPIIDGDNEIFLTASIGIVLGSTGDERAEDMVSVASGVAARARTLGVGRVEVAEAEPPISTRCRVQPEK